MVENSKLEKFINLVREGLFGPIKDLDWNGSDLDRNGAFVVGGSCGKV